MLDWTVEEKVLLNSRQVVVDGWRMNNQQLCTYLEKLLKNQNRVLPGRLGKGFLDITSQIAAGKIKACWSALMKDIEKLQELIQERGQWEEDNWFEFLQELEVQQDRYFKTQLGSIFIEALKYKLNLIEEPEEKKPLIDDDQEILPPFLREPQPEISHEAENDGLTDAEKSSKRAYFRKKTAKHSSKKSYFKKKTESEAEPETSGQDAFDETSVSDIIEWDPFKSDMQLKEKAETKTAGNNGIISVDEKSKMAAMDYSAEKISDRDFHNDKQSEMENEKWDPFKEQDGMKISEWDSNEEQGPAMETSKWDSFGQERSSMEMSEWDLFGQEHSEIKASGWDSYEESRSAMDASGWDSFGRERSVMETGSWDPFEEEQNGTGMAGWDLLKEEQKDAETDCQVLNHKVPVGQYETESEIDDKEGMSPEADERKVKGRSLEQPETSIASENSSSRLTEKLNRNSKKRISISKIIERTAIAVIACLSLCFIVFWLRDQIARNIDKWNISQIKIGSFGSAEEWMQDDNSALFVYEYGEYLQENSRYK